MSNGEDLTDEEWFDMIILIMDQNGGSIDRDQLLEVTGLNEDVLDGYMETLELRGRITFAHGSQTGRIENMEGWMLARLTENGIQRAREYDEE